MLVATEDIINRWLRTYFGAWDYIRSNSFLHCLTIYLMGVCLLLMTEARFNSGEVFLTKILLIDFKTAEQIITLIMQLLTAISFAATAFVGITQGLLNFKKWKAKPARKKRSVKSKTMLCV